MLIFLKNSKVFKSLLLMLVFVTVLSGCKPSDPEFTAGKGGNATFKILAYHDELIDDLTLYVKYNAVSGPANMLVHDTSVNATVFDDSVVAVKNITDTAFATFTQLKPGTYFIYAKGHATDGDLVGGGTPFTVKEEKLYILNCPAGHLL